MTTWLVAIVTVILIAVIVARRISPQFRQRSELPKHLFLANLGIPDDPAAGSEHAAEPDPSTSTVNDPGEHHRESHQP